MKWWRIVNNYYTNILPNMEKQRRLQEDDEEKGDIEDKNENEDEDEEILGLLKYLNYTMEIDWEDFEYPTGNK
jgi:hypothetical protein